MNKNKKFLISSLKYPVVMSHVTSLISTILTVFVSICPIFEIFHWKFRDLISGEITSTV